MGAEIFLPCAASRLVTVEHVKRLVSGGLELISAGANVPFADPEIFYGPTYEFADQHVAVIPDFIFADYHDDEGFGVDLNAAIGARYYF